MDEAERCSRVGLMYQGEIIRQGAPTELRQLVQGDLLAIVTNDLNASEALMQKLDGVSEVQVYGDRLHVFVDDAKRRAPEIQTALEAVGIRVTTLRQTVPHLQEVFVSLVTHQTNGRPRTEDGSK